MKQHLLVVSEPVLSGRSSRTTLRSPFNSLKGAHTRKNLIFSFYIAVIFGLLNLPVLAQSGTKYATGLNVLSATDGLGSSNYEGLNFYSNSVKRGSFTKDGYFNVFYKASFSANLNCDSIIKSWKIETDELNVFFNATIDSTLNVAQLTLKDNTITSSTGSISLGNNNITTTGTISGSNITTLTDDVSNLQTAVNDLNAEQAIQNSEIDTLQNEMLHVQSSWQNDSINPANIFYLGGNVGIGT